MPYLRTERGADLVPKFSYSIYDARTAMAICELSPDLTTVPEAAWGEADAVADGMQFPGARVPTFIRAAVKKLPKSDWPGDQDTAAENTLAPRTECRSSPLD